MADCIELILRNASSNPQNPCVIEGNRQVTYGEFASLVSSVASYLKANDCRKILVNMNQGVDSYVVIIATLLIGGYYCPLNLDSPEERKVYVTQQFNPDLIITQNNLIIHDSRIEQYKQLTVPQILSLVPSSQTCEQLFNANPDEISYVIYTSGSTGNPKGVIIRRTALNKFLDWSIRAFNCTPQDRWAQYSSLSFDLSIVDIFTSLCSGCAIVPLSQMGSKMRPANTISQQRITIWHSVPGAVEFMIQNERNKPADLSSVRLMSFCGEPLHEYHLEYLFSKKPDLTIFNTYGPTEGTLFCTWIELNKTNYQQYCSNNVSIGIAVPGWNVLLQDYDDETKQLIIYGDYLGKGYLNFKSDAFSVREIHGKNEHSYDTGDLVKEFNSNLYFVGRKDNQIKLRGYRIELDEIDNWIMKYTGAKTVSICYDDAIHSFIESNNIDENALRSFLEKNIEKYKIPSYFHCINNFPRNSNQKVNRLELKKIIDEKQQTHKPI